MKIRSMGTLCAVFALACATAAQTSSGSGWVGVWQGDLNGQPGLTLTLAEDTGTMEGTLVLNIFRRDGEPQIVAHEPHVLIHPQLAGDTLSFQLKRIDDSTPPMNFTVELTSETHAKVHCSNCGSDAPVIEIKKQN